MGLRHVILAAIHDGPRSAYDIASWLNKSRNIVWTASYQQIYRDLGLIADQGLATVSHFADKKIYTVTPLGRTEIKRWVSKRTPTRTNDEVIAKLLTADLAGSKTIVDMLQREIADQQSRLKMLRSRKADFGNGNAAVGTAEHVELWALRLGIRETEIRLDWLTELATDYLPELSQDEGADHERPSD